MTVRTMGDVDDEVLASGIPYTRVSGICSICGLPIEQWQSRPSAGMWHVKNIGKDEEGIYTCPESFQPKRKLNMAQL